MAPNGDRHGAPPMHPPPPTTAPPIGGQQGTGPGGPRGLGAAQFYAVGRGGVATTPSPLQVGTVVTFGTFGEVTNQTAEPGEGWEVVICVGNTSGIASRNDR